MSVQIQIGLDVIRSYRRLSYTPWHALAEFVDNSTQAYFNNTTILNQSYKDNPAKNGTGLTVGIVYDRENDSIRISDNSMGMDEATLDHALHVGKPPENVEGSRSRYGMGMKTAACWLGDEWKIRTKKLGESKELSVTIDVEKIAAGDPDVGYTERTDCDVNHHYTVIEISKLRKQFRGKTLGKIKDFLRSMYREDLTRKILHLEWRGEKLEWEGLDSQLLKAQDGSIYKKDFIFEFGEGDEEKRVVEGWVGILDKGSRAKAGFSMLHCTRVIRGWPDSWRPPSVFGQIQGSNDLVNQRLVGEIRLDDFEVSHTKDDILWEGNEEEEVDRRIGEECREYRDFAKKRRKGTDERGPSTAETDTAVEELQRELTSPAIVDAIELTVVPDPEAISTSFRRIIEEEETGEETFRVDVGDILVKVFLTNDKSENDPYFVCDATKKEEISVVINQRHPHWYQLSGSEGVLNYLRHCIYDALSEHLARFRKSTIEPDTIKLYKDMFLRIQFEMERLDGPESTENGNGDGDDSPES